MTPLESFYLRTEGLPWSRSIPGQNDSPGVVSEALNDSPGVVSSQDIICCGMEQLKVSHSVLGWNESRGIILSWDRTTP